MNLAVPKETAAGERRVALVPDAVKRLTGSGWTVRVETGAGRAAGYPDEEYRDAGAELVADRGGLLAGADLVVRVRKPEIDELNALRPGATVLGLVEPLTSPELIRAFAERKITAIAMETIPRVTRAQSMDALSSQASIAGYKAVLVAANLIGRYVPMLVTAAGTIAPSKLLVLGAGVAGLQALATARRLGAVISAYDVRSSSKEEVESLGARFIEPPEVAEGAGGYARELAEEARRRQLELLHPHVAGSDIVITTAQIPGRPAPLLVTEDMVREMRPGSVVVDLAAASGGNCELTRPDEVVEAHGVLIHGIRHAAALVPTHASQVYARNIVSLLGHLAPEGEWKLDFEDEITAGCIVVRDGVVTHERIRAAMEEGAS